jgi:hypothetical protein
MGLFIVIPRKQEKVLKHVVSVKYELKALLTRDCSTVKHSMLAIYLLSRAEDL